jgi:hypothetical protein
MAPGKDSISYPHNGNSNEARVWLSANTIRGALAAGGSSAIIALLSTAVGNLSGPVQAVMGVVVGFGISSIASQVGVNNGAVFMVGLGQASTFGISSFFGYQPVWDIQSQ